MMGVQSAQFGDLLRRHRRSVGLTQEKLAERAGLSLRGISDLERGLKQRPHKDTIRLLADALELTPAERALFEVLGRQFRVSRATELVETADQLSRRRGSSDGVLGSESSLPIPPTPLIGREEDLVAVQNLIGRPEVRLLTLSGAGGSGKTRLGLAVAKQLSNAFADGVFFVDLAPIGDPSLVIPVIARTLGLREGGSTSLWELLREYLRARQVLLVLDNFEQVVEAATAVSELLGASPQLKIIATSRVRLHLRWEYEYVVSPLALPDRDHLAPPAALLACPAVALFVDRARSIKPSFGLTTDNAAAVAEICIRLDGLPLAIELAAARIKLLSPPALLARLERRLDLLTRRAGDAPDRHQALRSTLDWSHRLLDRNEQCLFRRLAVFIGGCSLDAVEAIDGTFSQRIDLIDCVTSLVDKSLLQVDARPDGEPRVGMLETIRDYARERLEASGELAVMRERHAEYYLALAEAAERGPHSQEPVAWSERLEREHDNLRAALEWSLEHPKSDLGLRLASILTLFWIHQGYLREGQRWLEATLAHGPADPTRARAKALIRACYLVSERGDWDRAIAYAEASLEISQKLELKSLVANCMADLGRLKQAKGDLDSAVPLLEEGLRLYRELGVVVSIAISLDHLGLAALTANKLEVAAPLFAEGLARAQETGDQEVILACVIDRALLGLAQGDQPSATRWLDEGRRRAEQLGSKQELASYLDARAAQWVTQGQPARAAQLWGAAEAIRAPSGFTPWPECRDIIQRYQAAARVTLADAAFEAAWMDGRAMSGEILRSTP